MLCLFDSSHYHESRPSYPRGLHSDLPEKLMSQFGPGPYRFLDLACGTGHATLAWLELGLRSEVTLLDQSQSMLEVAHRVIGSHSDVHVDIHLGSADDLALQEKLRGFDIIFIGSALHWMDGESVRLGLLSALKQNGLVRVFEYQYPKVDAQPELNAWIKAQFNLLWRAPGQTPRGRLIDITRALTLTGQLKQRKVPTPLMQVDVSIEWYCRHLFSQSRVLWYLEQNSQLCPKEYFNEVSRHVHSLVDGKNHLLCDFKLQMIELEKV